MKKLKTKQIYLYQIHEGEVFDRHLSLKEAYDSEGRLTYGETYDDEGKVKVEESRKYDNNKLSEISVIDYQNHTQQRTEYKYEGDKIVNEIEHFEGGNFVKSQISYNEDGKVELISKIDEASDFLGKSTFHYDSTSKEVNEYDDENFHFSKVVARYDDKGNEIETIHTEYYNGNYPKSDKEIVTSVKRTFDQNNKLQTEEGSRYGSVFYRRKCEYDSQENLISTEIFNHDVNYLVVVKYKYNSLNKPVEESEFRNGQKIYTKAVRYDAEGYVTEESFTQSLVDNYQEVTKKEIINEFHT